MTLTRTACPKKHWPLVQEHIAAVNNLTSSPRLNWKTPTEIRHGCTPDISPFLKFQFYELASFQEDDSFAETEPDTNTCPEPPPETRTLPSRRAHSTNPCAPTRTRKHKQRVTFRTPDNCPNPFSLLDANDTNDDLHNAGESAGTVSGEEE